ncbi:hypothetical protein H0H92_009010 [Tricholoma furcatifolium]|nr:hypothetical protein H0H92_009010 [Tricholoma furcatifolium]
MAKAKKGGANEPPARKKVETRWTYVPVVQEQPRQQQIDINAPRQTRGGAAPAPAPAVPTGK